ncbi:MAG: hypothetical protein AUJ28_02265 [Parcubacteria group bacterium CG1_02_37_51]|uniref:Bacterial type II secretion system protein E domain-containing protein n=2 Tax=Candidatus Komeiliibacteriota TaxID=1817908 RepID=A0A2M8DS39_9BACT|nr:MAG: hypothetical protein AUJ28_02265 [Parcubacteria group bacterium CG1_02_37_51]PIY95196.1 MAG: hypothetical protein COY67_01230 [Candidatus Komeilibacteria bacterium CG_4_10_14_0_8_um_filter_37_78]PJC02202.1 MAG: hypothetical protein CO073_00720 [Candidatus Komeilibacteria bacterium CG_4_9_14_0_8_um_filter_36_9]
MNDDFNNPHLNVSSDETADALNKKLSSINQDDRELETEITARAQGLGYINLRGLIISADAIALIPKEDALAKQVVCFFYNGSTCKFGTINPAAEEVITYCQKIATAHNVSYQLYQITPASLKEVIRAYDKVPKIRETQTDIRVTEDDLERMKKEVSTLNDLKNKLTQVPTTEIITLIIASALKFDTSDIHIEAEENDVKLRLRIDGELTTIATIPKDLWQKIASRVKLLAGLKLNLTTKPQDGRFTIFLSKSKIDVRVSTIPTFSGESIAMRLLHSSSVGLQFEELGLRGKSFQNLEYNIKRPNGMIVATGPTGSGKTTTLYAILNKLNDEKTKIITLENPIEYKLEGINQSQIDNSKGYTFSDGLKSILRQDPDIVMVGEIRDLETADVAINAALTGHLMVSTIHTNSAAGAIPRFLAMGVKSFLLAPAINAVIGQRLVRRLCSNCKKKYTPDEETLTKVKNILAKLPEQSGEQLTPEKIDALEFYEAIGCDQCHNGYKGRIGVYEIFTMNEEIEKMILAGNVSEYDAERIAVQQGMVTMIQDGLLKASEGITSLEEAFSKTHDKTEQALKEPPKTE